MLARIKVIQVAQHVLESIADLAVIIGDLSHQLFRSVYVLAKINRGRPQPHNFSPHAVGDVHGIDSIAERLRHGLALRIEGPTVSHDFTIWRVPAYTQRAEQGRVKPAAILVSAFQV